VATQAVDGGVPHHAAQRRKTEMLLEMVGLRCIFTTRLRPRRRAEAAPTGANVRIEATSFAGCP